MKIDDFNTRSIRRKKLMRKVYKKLIDLGDYELAKEFSYEFYNEFLEEI